MQQTKNEGCTRVSCWWIEIDDRGMYLDPIHFVTIGKFWPSSPADQDHQSKISSWLASLPEGHQGQEFEDENYPEQVMYCSQEAI